jgi:murein DD-endopeptidase MepM/ murein hydrolase activator NlpD
MQTETAMRRIVLLILALICVSAAAPAAASEEGGALPPSASGGTSYGQTVSPREIRAERRRREKARRKRARIRRRRALRARPVLTAFALSRPHFYLYGRPAQATFSIRSRAKSVRVKLRLVPAAGGRAVRTVDLGSIATRTRHTVPITGLEGGLLPQGHYRVRIAARDKRGRRLRRGPRLSSAPELSFFHHRFPVLGPFSYGGKDSRFGAPRRGHTHQGQDLAAAEGVPLLAPRGGRIEAVKYQAGGAGHYVVLDGSGEDLDYVFMHLRSGSTLVREGQRVLTGQKLAEVGNTGGSSGPHLHFEIWVGGWYSGGKPIDPLPLLRSWDAWS